MKLSQTTRQSWQALYDQAINSGDRTIEVTVNTADANTGDVTNLRYFFPLASYLLQKERISAYEPLILDISLSGSAQQRTEDRERLQAFFSQLLSVPTVKIKVDGSILTKREWAASRIFPLCQVESDGKAEFPAYRVLGSCLYDRTTGANREDGPAQQYALLGNALLKLVKSADQYKGTQDRSFKTDEKKQLCDEVNQCLNNHLADMTILSQIIWLYILRELQITKQLYSIPEKPNEAPHVYKSILAKSQMDAVSYGEGIYQLIENSCIHSYGKKAWFGFRMYESNRGSPMGKLPGDIRIREILYEKYKLCFTEYPENASPRASAKNIFNEDHNFYFEFYVVDDAADQLGMIGRCNRMIFSENRDQILQCCQNTLTKEELAAFQNANCENDIAPYREKWTECEKTTRNERELRTKISTVDALFDLEIREQDLEKHLEDITVHYGLRLLRKIISVNGGYLLGRTPNGANNTQYYLNGNFAPKSDKKEKSNSYVTDWSAILPITYYWPEPRSSEGVVNGQNCFGAQIERPRKDLFCIQKEHIFRGLTCNSKIESILQLNNNLTPCLSGQSKQELEDSVICLNLENCSYYELEVFAKALFSQIASIRRREEAPAALRVALLFDNFEAIHEFIRLFSIFYWHGVQSDMEGTQIALCIRRDSYADVAVMLAGISLKNVYNNARLFAYHHSEDTLEYLPLLNYLTTQDSRQEQVENTALFPFELCLPYDFPGTEKQLLDWQNNWFIRRMNRVLTANIRETGYGCKINNIHIRLGSKIHLTQFYEAELLFQNMGNIARFAYMLAQDLLYGKNSLAKDKQVLLLGYEKYSATLMLQVEYWLRQSHQFEEVYTAIIYDGADEGQVDLRTFFARETDSCAKKGEVQTVAILPVGTTLSTIYKMQNTASRELMKWFDGCWNEAYKRWNFCLILANKDLNAPGISEMTSRYWCNIEKDQQQVTVRREHASGTDIRVKYLLGIDAEWMDPHRCGICQKSGKEIRPIIDAKQANTIPGAIFTLWKDHAGSFSRLVQDKTEREAKERGNRLSALYGNIIYSHIYSGNNHFQYYLDFQRIFVENQQEIMDDLRKHRVSHDGFHVVISPLQITNASFVKAVIDCVFDGNVRFLHMDFNDAYREEVRTKFSYLSQEFRHMRRTNPNAKFCINYVDNSIVTGTHLNRARLLIQMLLQQSNMDYSDVRLFDKVFLLVSRSSYDSSNYFVRMPEHNLYAYIHLAIPSYNTENDFCPACKVAEKYELLGKRSSTERLSGEFLRLQNKHKKRTPEEYHRWLDGAVLNSQSYLSWIKQWMYVNLPDSQCRLLSFNPYAAQKRVNRLDPETAAKEYDAAIHVKTEFCRFFEDVEPDPEWGAAPGEENTAARLSYLQQLNKNNLGQVVQYVEASSPSLSHFRLDVLNLVKTHLIAERNYMRLVATQRSYEALECDAPNPQDIRNGKYRVVMLKLIASAIQTSANANAAQLNGLTKAEKDRFLLAYNTEWLISYIKVLSRPQIATYYDYRQAITGIMSDMLRLISSKDWYLHFSRSTQQSDETPYWRVISKLLGRIRNYSDEETETQLCAQLCYQVNIILVHRLADLQTCSCADADSAVSIMNLYSELTSQYFSKKSQSSIYVEMPPSDKVLIRYLKAAKSETMASHDDVPCLAMTTVPDALEQRLNQYSSSCLRDNLCQSARYIYMENTRMLYSGMHDLEKQIPGEILARVDSYRPADAFPEYMKILGSAVDSCLRECYLNAQDNLKEEDILYQSVLGNFCRFWHKSTGEAPVSAGSDINRLAYMLQYFRRLNRLSSENGDKLDNDDLPYIYEEVCRSICGFTGFQMCYIAYCSAGNIPEIFAQSGYHIDLMKKGMLLTSSNIDKVLRHAFAEKQAKENVLIPGIAKCTFDTEKVDYLVLYIPLAGESQEHNGFYIVLQAEEGEKVFGKDPSQLGKGVLRKARDVLFMRNKLQEALSRDYTVLINFRFDCSYVRVLSPKEQCYPSVMHISDLHIQQDMSRRDSDLEERIMYAVDKASNPFKIDLLVISGDIVDGRDANAIRLEKNYRYAEHVLNVVATTLWKDSNGYLPHDWRRRIIITTGNHDYASMNQYQAAQKRRSLTSAMPAEGESGTMSKFAYFIDFLVRYLDPPIDELLRNDLNEVRFYRKLNLKVLTLNCSARAVPRRTNKMGVNESVVNRLLKRDVWTGDEPQVSFEQNGKKVKRRPFRLVVGHYSPQYNLSYFRDNFNVLPGWIWEPSSETHVINDLVVHFEKAVQEVLRDRQAGVDTSPADAAGKSDCQSFCNAFDNLKKAMEVVSGIGQNSPDSQVDAYCQVLNSLIEKQRLKPGKEEEAVEAVIQSFEKNDLYRQIKKLYDWLTNSPDDRNEEISELLYDVDESILMSTRDKKQFKDFITSINGSHGGQIDLYLSGHIHAYAESFIDDQEDKGDSDILVADKFFPDNSSDIHGYLIWNLKKSPEDAQTTGMQVRQYRHVRLGAEPNKDK